MAATPNPITTEMLLRKIDVFPTLDHVEIDITRSLLLENSSTTEDKEDNPLTSFNRDLVVTSTPDNVRSSIEISDQINWDTFWDINDNRALREPDIAWSIETCSFLQYPPGFVAAIKVEHVEETDFFPERKRCKRIKKYSDKSEKRFVEGKPKQPLSAYNFFFRDERTRILRGNQNCNEEFDDELENGSLETKELDSFGKKNTPATKRGRPRGPNYKKRKPKHGKISFQNLAKQVGLAWKAASPSTVAKYKEYAAKDRIRYDSELAVFKQN